MAITIITPPYSAANNQTRLASFRTSMRHS